MTTPDLPRRRFRRIGTILICLLLGAISTISIAWTSAAFLRFDQLGWGSRGVVALDGDHLQPWLISLHRPSADRTIWFEKGRIWSKPGVGPPGGSSAAVSCWSFATSTRGNPRFTTGPVDVPEAVQRETTRSPMTCWGGAEDSRGWPLAALRGRIFGATDPRADSVWFADHASFYATGIDTTTRMSESLATVRILPLEPLWRGIAVDILALGAIWWLGLTAVTAAAGAIKARFRIPAGHCPKCGYDLVGDLAGGCPECGWNRPDSQIVEKSAPERSR